VYDERYFDDRVRAFYADLDRGIRTIGSERLGAQDIFYRLSRFWTPALEYSEIKRVCADVDSLALDPSEPSGLARWPLAWGRAAKRYQSFAEQAEAAGQTITAGEHYLRASHLAHAGQMMCRPEWPEKIELQRARAQCYRKAARHLGLEEHWVPYNQHKLPGYLWLPVGIKRPPVVLLAPGADSTKEECHRWAQAFVARGLAAFHFDGPGQGELTPLIDRSLPMRLERYHEAFTAIIDYLQDNASDRVDATRVAIWGQSMGGHVVLRAFEHEKRPLAGVNVGAPPKLAVFPLMPADVEERIRDLFGFTCFEETWAYIQEEGDAVCHAHHIDVPFLTVHGSRDPLVTDETIRELSAAIGQNSEVHLYRDGNHGVFNYDSIMTGAMADWVTAKLTR